MNFIDFKNEIQKMTQQKVGSGYTVSLQDVLKTNDQVYTGIIIKNVNENIAPAIYLEDFYRAYLKGQSLDSIANQIVNIYNREIQSPPLTQVPSREDFLAHLNPTVVNAELNKSLLTDIPHRTIEDLAVYPKYKLDNTSNCTLSFNVTNDLLSHYNMTKDEVINAAIDNMKPSQFKCQTLLETIFDLSSKAFGELNEDDLTMEDLYMPVYVITTLSKTDGAACLASKEVLSDVGNKLQDDYYILPSSIHEVLAVPKSYIDNPTELQTIVREINQTHVAPNELLSNNIYQFNCISKKLQLFNDNPIKKIVKTATHTPKL